MDERTRRAICSAKTVAAVLRLAAADRRLAITVDQLDRDPWLLNTEAGTVELRTGRMREHRRLDYITKITGASPGGACPLWLRFLNRVTAGDRELAAYLRRVVGYCLTGSTQEHAMFFLHGTGTNGKGVFTITVSGMLGEYAMTSPTETFIASATDHHPTDLARLHGARLVTATETERNRRWAESRIKAVTAGDPVTARFMRQDFFTYVPQFKLLVTGNHKPGLRGVDEAIRRRFNLIPFTVTIPKEERDPELAEKLKAEWPGILAWAIEGCLEWQRVGLAPPEAVRNATADYLESEDALGQWLAERCLVGPSFQATSGDLFQSWKEWAEAAGEHVGSQKALTHALQDRDFTHKKRMGHASKPGFEGLAPRPKHESDPSDQWNN